MTFEWKIYARDQGYQRQGEVDDYIEASFTLAFNDVGTWSITMDRRAKWAYKLTQPGWGIIIVRNGVTIMSGPFRQQDLDVSYDPAGQSKNEIKLSGFTDDVWLKRRLVSPSPAEPGPTYTAQAYDDRTGLASTVLNGYVNADLGPGAVTTRRKANLVVGTDPLVGATVKGHGRWDTDLLAFLQPIALSGGVGFRIVQVGAGLEFQVYPIVDKSATVKFSNALGNLAAFQYTSTAPSANYVYVGSTGTGTSRIIKEYQDSTSVAAWERIEGALVGEPSTTDDATLQQTGNDALAAGGEQASLKITPIETANLTFGVHYGLGDKVTVQLDQGTTTPYAESSQIVDVLRQVNVSLTPDGPQVVAPTIGTSARTDVLKLIRAYRDLVIRVNKLERT